MTQRKAVHVNELNDELTKIENSGALGRSPVYSRLLRYLASATASQKPASEVEIATEVFSKGGDFDSNQDSTVRVYVHNLRQRLDKYYEQPLLQSTTRISIPKGEYTLVSTPVSGPGRHTAEHSESYKPNYKKLIIPMAALLLITNLAAVGIALRIMNPDTEASILSESAVWNPLLESDLPLLVVVGDYYIFAELDTDGNIVRMVREFDINSSSDLSHLLEYDPERPYDYMDLDLTYLPQSIAFALKDLLSVVYTTDKRVNVLPASKVRISDLKSNDVLYVGYLSGLGVLEEFVFNASSLEIGDTYDELTHKQNQKHFLSNAGIPEQGNYRDYGFVSSFQGPSNENRMMIVAGMRDSGLMHMAQILSSDTEFDRLLHNEGENTDDIPLAYELLFQVTGSDRTSLSASKAHFSEIDESNIWAHE